MVSTNQPLNQPSNTNNSTNSGWFDKEKIKDFYKESLPKILKTIFTEPIEGTYSLLSEKTETSYFNSLVLLISTGIHYILIPYIIAVDMRSMVGFGTLVKIGLEIIAFMLVITAISFGIKSISGKPLFKNELLTGALYGIPLSLLIISILLLNFFSKSLDVTDLLSDRSLEALQSGGIIIGFLMLFIFFMFINIIQQSLKSAGRKDSIAWYISPIAVLTAFYITSISIEKQLK